MASYKILVAGWQRTPARRRCAVIRQRLIAVVGAFLIGCAFLLLAVGCAGTRSEAPKKKQQGHTAATNTEQGHAGEATSPEEEARCEGTRSYHGPSFLTFHPEDPGIVYTTNDLPGCPKGGLLLGTDKPDQLGGEGWRRRDTRPCAEDYVYGGSGDDVIYGGPGDDSLQYVSASLTYIA